MGQLRLPVMVGNKEHSTTAWMNFMVIRSPSPYNGIIGRPGISAIRAVPSTAHGMLKFPVDGGIVTIYNIAVPPKECNTVTCDVTQTQRHHATKVTNLKVAIHPDYPEQEVSIGGSLSDTGRVAVCALLQRNLDIFAWEPKHMTGVPRSITEHKLKIRQGYSPVRQKRKIGWRYGGQLQSKLKAILEEVHKLWGSWRMCVDFTDLNKACPQDCYPLPEIDWKVESLCGYPFKCFLDAYKGYHQIQMAKDDEEKTAFHTSQGVYCYTKMPFGLKNAGATYQRLVDNAFEGQVGRNLEVYVDDLVIKSHTEDELVRDIVETFRALRKINMKLNPKKCTFGATEGMFLGYLIEPDGIKPCPEKTKAVIQLPSPRTMKEVQSLNGKLAVEQMFIQVSSTSTPLVQNPQEVYEEGSLRWTTEAAKLSRCSSAYSSTSHANRDSVQTPVYFVSKALKETEINYSAMEKLILALVFAAKRLRRYFQAHPIATTHAVKGQILADFLIEKPETDAVLPQSEVKLQDPWILFTDGSSCVDGSGAGLILTNPEGMEFTYALRFEFSATNNEAEYEALIAGLRIAARMGVRNLEANVDSRLVANHVLGEYVAKEDNMIQYLDRPKDALSKIRIYKLRATIQKQVLVKILRHISIVGWRYHGDSKRGSSWMTPLLNIIEGLLHLEQKEARMHSGPRSVVARALRSGYYWPTMHRDARDMIKKCHDCQVHRHPRQTTTELTPSHHHGHSQMRFDIAESFPLQQED
ncbi:reverse transcriptase domain-containing protein [Tanacetum coccineum]